VAPGDAIEGVRAMKQSLARRSQPTYLTCMIETLSARIGGSGDGQLDRVRSSRKRMARIAKSGIAFLVLANCQSSPPVSSVVAPAPTALQVIELSRDATWSRLLNCLPDLGIQLDVINQNDGVILASGPAVKGEFVDSAARLDGEDDYFEDCQYTLCIVLESRDERNSVISVRLGGTVVMHVRQYLFYLPLWYVRQEVVCDSTGKLEAYLLWCLRK
jgi:hypothetical protein